LLKYDWLGNVRELINTLERAIVVSGESPTLFSTYLPAEIRIKVKRDHFGEEEKEIEFLQSTAPGSGSNLMTFHERREAAIAEMEKQYLGELIAYTKGNIKEACKVSGLSRSRLYGLLKKHDISPRG